MKVANWRKKLAATLVASGLLAPSALRAANLDANLVVDPGFEDVNTAVTCCASAVQLNSWADGAIRGFAYNYGQGYDEGGPLAGGGIYYFLPNTDTGQVLTPGQVSQNINVAGDATGALIASGEAAVNLAAFFTSYHGLDFHGSLHVEFLNAGGTSLGSAALTAKTPRPWHQERAAGFIPIGTATLRASVFGDNRLAYIDNVDVQVTNAANELLFLEVNTTTGQAAIKNQTGDPFHIDYYRIRSAGSALNATAWNSLQEQNLAGFPAGNGSGNGWEQFGGSTARVIGESYLTGSSLVANSSSIGLGAAFNVGGAHDLTFQYGVVTETALSADFNGDGDVDGGDFLTWQRGLGISSGATKAQGDADADMDVDADDLTAWRGEFGSTSFGAPGTLTTGFVRYVTGAATAVPEASSVLLAGIGLATLAAGARRTAK
jgi:hypothetical protein